MQEDPSQELLNPQTRTRWLVRCQPKAEGCDAETHGKDASVDLHLSSDRVVSGIRQGSNAHLEENCNRRWSSRSSCSRRKYKRLREPQKYCHGPDGQGAATGFGFDRERIG